MGGRSWTSEDDEHLIKLFNDMLLSYEQIGKKLGRSIDSVEHRIRQLRTAGILNYRTSKKVKDKYEKDLSNVKQLTPNGAYFITSLLGDGHLRERYVQFGFRKRDCAEFRDIMCHILNIAPPLHICKQRVFVEGKWFDEGKFFIYSVELAKLLAYTYGVPMGAKSGLIRLPRLIMKSSDSKLHGAVLRAAYECEGGVNPNDKALCIIIGQHFNFISPRSLGTA